MPGQGITAQIMAFCITSVNPEFTSKEKIEAVQYPLILQKNQHPSLSTVKGSQQGKGLHEYPPLKKLEAIALQSRIIKATDTCDGYRVRINLDIPIRFTRSEIERLIEATDDWAGWGDDPRRCLADLGGLIDAAISAVGGAK